MAIFTASTSFDYRNVLESPDGFDASVTGGSGRYTFTDGFLSIALTGTSLSRSGNDFVGTLNSLAYTVAGDSYISITGMTYGMGPNNQIYDNGYAPTGYAAMYRLSAEVAKMLEGNDTLKGSIYSDRISGFNGNDNVQGNGGKDWLEGGAGNDTLNGGVGNDTLAGGAGTDYFVFNTALNAATNKDTIVDFSAGIDKIQLENAVMTKLAATPGVLGKDAFALGTAALDATDRIIYNKASGALYYDADGKGGAAAVQFAVLGTSSHPTVSNTDFLII